MDKENVDRPILETKGKDNILPEKCHYITSMVDFIMSQKDETEMEPSCVVPPPYHFWFKEREKPKSGHFSVA